MSSENFDQTVFGQSAYYEKKHSVDLPQDDFLSMWLSYQKGYLCDGPQNKSGKVVVNQETA